MQWPDDPTDYKLLLSFMMHELRRIEGSIAGHANALALATRNNKPDIPRIKKEATLVAEEAMVLHSWLAIADLYLDPDQFAREPTHRFSLYDMFYRAIAVLSQRAKTKQIALKLMGDGKYYVNAHRVITVAPYILLDNALKYSPVSGEVTVKLETIRGEHNVEVRSVGPQLAPSELEHVFDAGIRGAGAIAMTAVGNGQGLTLLRTICTYHGGDVAVSSSPTAYAMNGIPYSEFVASIKLRDANAG